MIVFIRLATLDVSARPPGFAPGDRPAKCVEPDEITTVEGLHHFACDVWLGQSILYKGVKYV